MLTAIGAKCATVSPTFSAQASIHGRHVASLVNHPRTSSVVTRAEAPGNSIIPEDGKGAAWDPDGILPPMPAGGHFARRGNPAELQQQPTAATTTVAASASSPVSDLLAPRKSSRSTPSKSTPAAVATPAPVAPVASPAAAQRGFGEVHGTPEDALGARVEAALLETFFGERGVPRVLESFRRLRAGDEFVQLWPGLGLQKAGSYVAGLTAYPFPDMHNGQYSWLVELEKNAGVIQEEFKAAMKDGGEGLKNKGNRVWVPAARDEAVAYGPNWRTLVIQDRGVWEETNSKLFPKTTKMLKDLKAPTLEVFFARQDGKTGIKSHTDNSNFIQTTHLGIDVPEGECWIKVGDFTKEWQNGKIIICDTSFMHETQNNSEKDRYVLIMRHWHPEVTPLERVAMQFLFAALDDGTPAGIKAAQKVASKELKGLVGVGKSKKGSGGGGFGGSGGGFGKK